LALCKVRAFSKNKGVVRQSVEVVHEKRMYRGERNRE